MVVINPLDVFLWTVRKNEKDVVKLYNSLSPVMQLATGGNMLNFGYWTDGISKPVPAQENLCREFESMAKLETAETIVDLGSGLSGPAAFWLKNNPHLKICCVNTSFAQLASSRSAGMALLNSTSTLLPFSDRSADRVLALESSQHFKPYEDFVRESRRVLKPAGILALALPVTLAGSSVSNMGLLKFTWSSEHYRLADVRSMLDSGGFDVSEEVLIGKSVYEPLADFYIQNRQALRRSIMQRYPAYVEKILFQSIQRMKRASQEKIIEYALFTCMVR